MAKFCRNCGAALPDGAAFCPECGKALVQAAPAKKYCRSCGAALRPGAAFCAQCGAKVNGAAPTKAAPAAPAPPKRTSAADPQPKSTRATDFQAKARPSTRATDFHPTAKAAPEKKKRHWGRRFVALAAVVVFCFTGFVNPGFLRSKDKPSGSSHSGSGSMWGGAINPSSGSSSGSPSGGSTSGAQSTSLSSAPASTEELSISFSSSELSSAPAISAPVSQENPIAVCGDITVDLKSWNLPEGGDTLTVRDLGTKTDEAAGWTLEAYDFSLASGTHAFYTNVEIRFPKPADEDSALTSFVTYNEQTGRWEDLYSEVSADGSKYLVYTKHFTPVAKKKILFLEVPEVQLNYQKTDVLSQTGIGGDLFVELFHGSARTSYSSTRYSGLDRMLAPVKLDFDRYWYLAETGQLPGIKKVLAEYEQGTADIHGLFTTLNKLDDKSALYQMFEEGMNVGPNLAEVLMMPEIEGPLGDVLDAAGTGLSILDVIATYTRITTDAKLREKTVILSIGDDHKLDLANGIMSAIGTYTGVMEALGYSVPSPVSLGLAVISLSLYAAGKADEAVSEYGSNGLTEKLYHFYNLKPFTNLLPLISLPGERYEELAAFVREHPLGYGWEKETETGDLITDPSWVPLVTKVLNLCQDTPEIIPDVLDEIITQRSRAYFTLTEDEQRSVYNEYRKKYPDDLHALSFHGYDADERANLAPMEKARLRTWMGWAAQEVQKLLEATLEKQLNQVLVFHVQDQDAERFQSSPYCQDFYAYPFNEDWRLTFDDVFDLNDEGPTGADYADPELMLPMYFENVKEPLFQPIDQASPAFDPKKPNEVQRVSAREYYPYLDNFLPRAGAYHGLDEEDVVFKCTLYHYLMMGAPTSMVFQKYPEAALHRNQEGEAEHYAPETALTIGFVGTGNEQLKNDQIHITISVSGGFSEAYFAGAWNNGTVEVHLSHAIKSGDWEYEEALGSDRVRAVYQRFSIDARTKVLTLSEPGAIYKGNVPDSITFQYVDQNHMRIGAGGQSMTMTRGNLGD